MNDLNGSELKEDHSDLLNAVIIWGIAAIALSILMVSKNNSALVLGASIWAKIGACILASFLGLIGAIVGDVIRKFAAPDMFFTSGGMGQIIWIKLFWKVGPQLIGLLIGTSVGTGLALG